MRPLHELTAADLANVALRRVREYAERAFGKLRDLRVVALGSGFAFMAIDQSGDAWIAGYDPRPVTHDMREWVMHAEGDQPWERKAVWKKQPKLDRGAPARAKINPPFVSQHVRTLPAREYIAQRFAMMDKGNESVGEALIDEQDGSYLSLLASMMEARSDDTPKQRMLREALMAFALTLDEGIFDPYILKAVFLGGGGGSGKGFISNIMFGTANISGGATKIDTSLTSFGLKSLNADDGFTHMLRKAGIPTSQVASPEAQAIRDAHVDRIERKRQELWVKGRLGLIVDGTAKNPVKVRTQRQMLEDLGYDTYMVFVDTTLEVALANNIERHVKKGDRLVPEEALRQAHAQAQAAKTSYAGMFGAKNTMFIDNSVRLSPMDVTAVLVPKLHRAVLKFIQEPLKNPAGKAWLASMTQDMPPEMKKLVPWIGKPRGA